MELVSLSDAVDTTGIANELRSFHRADVIVEASDRGGELCYVAVEASYTVNGRDSSRAIRNAGLLAKFTGCRSYAVVAGLRRDGRIQDRYRSGPCGQLPRLAVAVAVSAFAFFAAAVSGSAQELRHFLLKQSLQPLLDVAPGHLLQRLPARA